MQVRVDLDAPWLEADAPTGGAGAWTGEVLTATRLRASVQPTSRIATGIALLDRILVDLAKVMCTCACSSVHPMRVCPCASG